MQKGMDLLKAATKEVFCKKHLTFLSMHLWAFNIYLLALVTTSLLIWTSGALSPRFLGEEGKGNSLGVNEPYGIPLCSFNTSARWELPNSSCPQGTKGLFARGKVQWVPCLYFYKYFSGRKTLKSSRFKGWNIAFQKLLKSALMSKHSSSYPVPKKLCDFFPPSTLDVFTIIFNENKTTKTIQPYFSPIEKANVPSWAKTNGK